MADEQEQEQAIVVDDSDSDDEPDLEIILHRIAVPVLLQQGELTDDEDDDEDSADSSNSSEDGEKKDMLPYAEELQEPCGNVNWSNLPSTAVVHILRHLNDGNRARMARVCKNWLACFSDPCLWRTRFIEFRGLRGAGNGENAVGYARFFGPYLRHLNVVCDNPSFLLCKRFQQTMENFLNILCRTRYGACQLRSLNMLRLHVRTENID